MNHAIHLKIYISKQDDVMLKVQYMHLKYGLINIYFKKKRVKGKIKSVSK